jgi:hypothetical protein
MKKTIAALIGLGPLVAPVLGQTYRDGGGTIIQAVRPTYVYTPGGYCQLIVTSAVLTSTCPGGIPAGATMALVCNEGAAARWRDDGIAVTTSVGMSLAAGVASAPVCFNYYGAFAALQWIAQSGAAILDISFYE